MCVCVCGVGLLNHIHVYQTDAIPLQVDSLTKSTYSHLYVTCMWLICHLYVAYKSHTSFRILVYVSCKFLKLVCHLYVAYKSHICHL